MTRGIRFWQSGLVMLALALSGCAGYHLGPASGQTAGARSIQIEPFLNKTSEPRLSDAVMISLRRTLMQDGTYRVNTHKDGDIILTGEIISYERRGLSVQPTDVLTVLDYEVTMIAHVTARERNSDKILFEKNVTGRTALRAGTDLPSAERQVVPLLTDDLAKKTTALLVDGTW